MTSDGDAVERLRDYLKTVKPEARAKVAAELERGLLRGEESPGNELLLQELRRSVRQAGAFAVDRIGAAARLFFAPVEPFLVDDPADQGRVGRLSRRSLQPIWEWIGRDLMPEEARALSADINRALGVNDKAKAEQLTRALQDRALRQIAAATAAASGDDRARRRLAAQVGTPRAREDLATLTGVLAHRDQLGELARRLPNHFRAFEREQVDAVKSVLDATAGATPAGKNGVLPYGLLLVMSRLTQPWQLIRIAARAAESDIAVRIAETPYAVAVTIVLGEIECTLEELRIEMKARRVVTSLLKIIHDGARGLRTEIDLSGDSPWSRQLTAIRTEVSNLLRYEIDAVPGRVRRMLRPRPASEIASGTKLDATDVDEAEMLVELVAACRIYANELAVNEAALRSYSELQNYLESGTKLLLDSLRQASDANRSFRQSQTDAAIRFCRPLFGADYSGLLAKAAEIAAQTATQERRAASA